MARPVRRRSLAFQGAGVLSARRIRKRDRIAEAQASPQPDTDISRVLLAASYGQRGLIEEARDPWQDAFRVNPDYSLEHRRKVLPYKNPADFELVVEGFRKAGLPEP